MTDSSQLPRPAAAAMPSPALSRATMVAAIIAALLVGLVTAIGTLFIWLAVGAATATGITLGSWMWPAWQAALAVVGLLLLAPFALWRRRDPYSPFPLWFVGLLILLLAAPLKGIALSQMQVSELWQITLALLLGAIALVVGRGGVRRSDPRSPGIALAAGAALLMLIPWLIWGSLGSPLDLLLALVLALLIGLACAWLLAPTLSRLVSSEQVTAGKGFLAGLASSTFLGLVALALARDGQIVLLGVLLWAAGWLVPVLWRRGGRLAAALAIGGAALGPLALADPNELGLLLNLGSQDALAWLLRALLLSVVLALLVALVLPLLGRWLARTGRGMLPGLLIAGVAALCALGGYLTLGQPGFYGDRLFVLMSEQADLAAIPTTGDREARLQATYTTLVTHADRTQAPLRAQMDRLGIEYQPYYLVNAIEVRGGLLHRLWLSAQPGVERVLDSPTLRPLPANAPAARGDQGARSGVMWNLEMIGAPQVWEEFGARGAGIVLGQSDSGVQGDHPELADSYRDDGYSWFDPWNQTTEPTDIGGHGTHTTGTVLGNTVGVAPDAQWIGCVNLARNLANPALYLDCMQFMLAPFPQGGDPLRDGDPTRAAHVLNNSWGCPPQEGCDPTVLVAAVDALRHAGIFVVASAGNEGIGGCSTINDPIALYDSSFTVGAVDSSGDIADFSSLGPVTADGSNRTKPDIVAPGVSVLSSYPNNSYYDADGTSMAGPHVAGAVILLWSAVPELIGEIDRTEQLLIESATPYSGPIRDCGSAGTPNNTVGNGILNVYGAVKLARGGR